MYKPLSHLSLAFPLLILAACAGKATPTPSYQAEMFSTGVSPFAHNYDATSQETCEASRRALLSQGYMTTMTQPDTIDAEELPAVGRYTRGGVVSCGLHGGRERHQYEHRVRERRAGRLYAQEKRYVGERGIERARLALAADPLEQRFDGEDFQRNRAGRQVLRALF